MNYPRRILFLFIGVAVLFGIAYLKSTVSGNTEDALRRQLQSVWEAKKNRDFGKVYDMTAMAYQQKVSRDKFLQRGHVNVKTFSVKSVEIAESGKEARTVVEYVTNQMGFEFTFKAKESWTWEGGKWCVNISPVPLKLPGMK